MTKATKPKAQPKVKTPGTSPRTIYGDAPYTVFDVEHECRRSNRGTP